MVKPETERAVTDNLPKGHWKSLLSELSYLQPYVFSLQSVTKLHRYWNRVEENLNL